MTSMLLRLSMPDPRLIGAPRPAGPQPRDGLQRAPLRLIGAPRPAGPQPRDGLQRAPLLLRAALLDVLGHHVPVRGEPVGLLHQLAVLDLPDLHEPAAPLLRRRAPHPP